MAKEFHNSDIVGSGVNYNVKPDGTLKKFGMHNAVIIEKDPENPELYNARVITHCSEDKDHGIKYDKVNPEEYEGYIPDDSAYLSNQVKCVGKFLRLKGKRNVETI